MTIGKFETVESLLSAYNNVKGLEVTFKAMIETISVEMIGKNEESHIIIEKRLK